MYDVTVVGLNADGSDQVFEGIDINILMSIESAFEHDHKIIVVDLDDTEYDAWIERQIKAQEGVLFCDLNHEGKWVKSDNPNPLY